MKAVITAFARIRESIVGMAGLAIVLFWVLVAVFADIISPFDPLQQISPLATPGTEVEGGVLILGADFLGRDILSRIVHRHTHDYAVGAFGDGVGVDGGHCFGAGWRFLRRSRG